MIYIMTFDVTFYEDIFELSPFPNLSLIQGTAWRKKAAFCRKSFFRSESEFGTFNVDGRDGTRFTQKY